MIENFIDSALIIDDTESEIEKLREFLCDRDISVRYINPSNEYKKLRNRKIIFLDLYISKTVTEIKGNIAEIRSLLQKIIGKNFGSYGIIMWTKHDDEIELFKEKIKDDGNDYELPLFIFGINKNNYLRSGDYSQIFIEIDTEIKNNVAANFFINWSILVNEGRDEAIRNIYYLVPDYVKQNTNLEFLLFKMAQNYTGIPINKIDDYPIKKDAIKAFADILLYEIVKNHNLFNGSLFENIENIKYIFNNNKSVVKLTDGKFFIENLPAVDEKEIKEKEEEIKAEKKCLKKYNLYEEKKEIIEEEKKKNDAIKNNLSGFNKELNEKLGIINTITLLDEECLDNSILPGNIYEILEDDNALISKKINNNDIPIAIELTQPCDYANLKNDNPKLIGGFITKYSLGRLEQLRSDSFYKEAYPLKIKNQIELMILVFDFKKISIINELELKNNQKYQLKMRAKDRLFADILQKFSSYSARLGLAVLH